jgi:hypothetical protein
VRVFGGASRDRTDDPLLAKQVLSQLSYGPNLIISPTYSPSPIYGRGLGVRVIGGSGWTRTIDLTLIRGAL